MFLKYKQIKESISTETMTFFLLITKMMCSQRIFFKESKLIALTQNSVIILLYLVPIIK